ncbi:hypothetical protein RugamoR57_43640 [Duganella caerulea]|uniref:hypothetical protein n=1 Tax=Duganella caerulea TaxID=2885762 RepID=UPI0030EAD7FE
MNPFPILLALLPLAVGAARAQPLEATSAGRLAFDSYTPATMYDLARERRQLWAPQTVWGELNLLAGARRARGPQRGRAAAVAPRRDRVRGAGVLRRDCCSARPGGRTRAPPGLS